MTLEEAKNVAQRFCNFNSEVPRETLKKALSVLANFAEDIQFTVKDFDKK